MRVAATAPYVATKIGATNAFAYDLQAACSGFLFGMSVASSFIESGRYDKIILIGADKMSSIVDKNDRSTRIIFGDGAGAALIEASSSNFGWEDEYFRSDGSGRDLLNVKAGGSIMPITNETLKTKKHYLFQDGKAVFKSAVSKMTSATKRYSLEIVSNLKILPI